VVKKEAPKKKKSSEYLWSKGGGWLKIHLYTVWERQSGDEAMMGQDDDGTCQGEWTTSCHIGKGKSVVNGTGEK